MNTVRFEMACYDSDDDEFLDIINGRNYDFTIKTNSKEFLIHQKHFCKHSDFFKKMFTSKFREKYNNFAVIDEVSPEIMQIIVDFICLKRISVTINDLYDLFVAADYMQIPLLKGLCVRHLIANISFKSCIKSWKIAKTYNLRKLIKTCSKFMSNNIVSLMKTGDYLELNVTEVVEFIKMNNNTQVFEDTFEGAVRWVEYDKLSRQEDFIKLFKLVDLKCLKKSFLYNVVIKCELVQKCPMCRLRWLKGMTVDLENLQLAEQINQNEEIVTNGISNCFKFNHVTKSFSCLDKYKRPSQPYASMLLVDDELYAIGGKSDKVLDDCYSCNVDNLCINWKPLNRMSEKRFNAGCVVYNGEIYVAGGVSGKHWLSSVKSYNLRYKRWIRRPNMNYNRANFRLVVCDGLLYAVGGCQGERTYHDSVEVFNGRRWRCVQSMNIKRCRPAVVVLNNQIYAIGGQSDYVTDTHAVERYSPYHNVWEFVEDLDSGKEDPFAFVSNGQIYVVGEVKVYDPHYNDWLTVTPDRPLL